MFLSLHAVTNSVASATEQALTSYVVADVVRQCKPRFYYIYMYTCTYIFVTICMAIISLAVIYKRLSYRGSR